MSVEIVREGGRQKIRCRAKDEEGVALASKYVVYLIVVVVLDVVV